jgi:GTPase SAR1 family protein
MRGGGGRPGKVDIKTVLLGQASIGKTCLVDRFLNDRFTPRYESTVGAAFCAKTLQSRSGRAVTLGIWDTAGQDRYESCVARMAHNTKPSPACATCPLPSSLSLILNPKVDKCFCAVLRCASLFENCRNSGSLSRVFFFFFFFFFFFGSVGVCFPPPLFPGIRRARKSVYKPLLPRSPLKKIPNKTALTSGTRKKKKKTTRSPGMTSVYYRSSRAAVVCFDVTSAQSFAKVRFWVGQLRQHEPECFVVLVGTKKDLLGA